MSNSTNASSSVEANPNWLDLVRRKAEGLREGRIILEVVDGQVTEIECEENTCLFKSASSRELDNEADLLSDLSASEKLFSSSAI